MRRLDGVRALYICYFGVREPLVNTQVIPYLAELAKCGAEISLLTFEPNLPAFASGEEDSLCSQLETRGIAWFRLPYHKRPTLPATLYDVAAGTMAALRIGRQRGINLIHARSHVPALMAALAKALSGTRFIFDIRGFMADEYVDAGHWPVNGLLYRLTKAAERKLLNYADGFVVLTGQAREILSPCIHDGAGAPLEVIPCCVDFDRFRDMDGEREGIREELGWSGRRVLLYLGSLGGWYLSEEMAQFFAVAQQQDRRNFPVWITQSPSSAIIGRLLELGLNQGEFLVRSASPQEVPRLLAAADVAISFIKPGFSKKASSPTKMGEYLASGTPVICNPGIGDVEELISGERVGILVNEFTADCYRRALEQMNELLCEPAIRQRCRQAARKYFDLKSVGAERYSRLYSAVCEGVVAAGVENCA